MEWKTVLKTDTEHEQLKQRLKDLLAKFGFEINTFGPMRQFKDNALIVDILQYYRNYIPSIHRKLKERKPMASVFNIDIEDEEAVKELMNRYKGAFNSKEYVDIVNDSWEWWQTNKSNNQYDHINNPEAY